MDTVTKTSCLWALGSCSLSQTICRNSTCGMFTNGTLKFGISGIFNNAENDKFSNISKWYYSKKNILWFSEIYISLYLRWTYLECCFGFSCRKSFRGVSPECRFLRLTLQSSNIFVIKHVIFCVLSISLQMYCTYLINIEYIEFANTI